jgi:hypothetical protein
VAFGTVAAIEGTARVLANNPAWDINLSEAHLFFCHGYNDDASCKYGWYPSGALRAFQQVGVSDELCYKYNQQPSGEGCHRRCSDWQSRVTKITGYRKVVPDPDIKQWLATRGPMIASFRVYDDFMDYGAGVYRHRYGGYLAGHCVCCVGYDDAGGYWICKNSWGTHFGEQGYFRIAYGEVGIDAYMWGIEGVVGVQPGPNPLPAEWMNDKLITELWASKDARNAWIQIEGIGWKKLSDANDAAFYQLMTASIAAKAAHRRVNVREHQGLIVELYVF